MSLKNHQIVVDKWIQKHGVRYFDVKTNTLLLMEEVGEVARLIARIYGEQSFKDPISDLQQKELLEDELADVLFVLTCIANQTGIDLDKAMKLNMEKKTNRDGDRHHNNNKLRP